jgi:integrase/recombinase XerD
MMIMCPKDMKRPAANVERLTKILAALNPANMRLAEAMLLQLAEQEGIEVKGEVGSGLAKPEEGMRLWLAHLKQESYSEGTVRTYMSSLTALFKEHENPTRLDLVEWLAKRMETRSPTAVSTDRKALRSLFSFLKEEGLWPNDPTEKLKSIKVPKRMRDAPSFDEVQQLLEYACWKSEETLKYRTMTRVIATTGLRLDEAVSIRKDRIFFDRHEMVVIGKGSKERTVPLVPVAEAVLADFTSKHPGESAYIFPGNTKTGYWSGSSYEKTLSRACKKAGIRHYSPHTLRHFYATFMLQHGAKLEVVQHILGHASAGTTADIYRHVLTTEMHENVRQFAPMKDMPLALPAPTIEGEGRLLEEHND